MLSLTRALLTPVVLALALAVIVALVLVVLVHGTSASARQSSPKSSRTPASHPASSVPSGPIRWSMVVPRLDCAGVGTVVDARVLGDLDGDGRTDAVISAHCDAGAGSPPSVVEVFLDKGASPQRLADVVTTGDDLIVERVSMRQRVLTVRALGYSRGTPRCCPDKSVIRSWRVTTVAGTARLVRVH